MAQVTLQIRGLDCAEEVALLRDGLEPVPGVHRLSFDLLRGRATIDFDEQRLDVTRLIDEVGKTGLNAIECAACPSNVSPNPTSDHRRLRIGLCVASGLLALGGFVSQILLVGWRSMFDIQKHGTSWTAFTFNLLAALCGLWIVLPKAWSALVRLRPDMNFLMTFAVAGAFMIGESSEGATVAFLFALSLMLESWSIDRARRAVEALMTLTPQMALQVKPDGGEELVPAETVEVGSTIRIRPGYVFPLDGKIVRGETTVNEAPITGESVPCPKKIGDPVFAGTINEEGLVDFITSKPADDSILSHILRLVGEAQRRRSSVELSIEKFARAYTPVVIAMAAILIIVPPMLFHGAWSFWFYQGLVLLVIACPCALVISTPVSVIAALTSAAKHGVLVKGGRYLELAAQLKAIAFDKTGTLTIGRPKVCQVIPLNSHSESELLEIAHSVGLNSSHPLSRAIADYASTKSIRSATIAEFRSVAGRGVSARIENHRYWIGSFANLVERGLDTPELDSLADALNHEASSIVAISDDERALGLITLSDSLRPEAVRCIERLRQIGIEPIVMLTGDNPRVSSHVSNSVGINDVRSELLPEDKVVAIQKLVGLHGVVAMVGDGINDAPAMAQASFGIAMGHFGTDTALETADVVLMNDDLSEIPWLVIHARRMRAIIHQNVIAALAVKAGFALLTLVGHGNLWSAIAADTGMSLIVVLNALRLLSPMRDDLGR